ncbi:phage tail protein [Methylobacillus glycogenes]|uniref:phage tail protein n=1 Tax=Methylobacillus glycogenes TaxID=406 RepID=UPI00046F065F|nr:phage tail protein [Methylobacillus glycogenes]
MMLALGLFIFQLDTLPYQEMQHKIAWRHPNNSRVGKRPSRQFTGPDDESMVLRGVLLPEITGGAKALDLLRYMGDSGEAWSLVEGTGRVYGFWVIEQLDTSKGHFFKDGAARRYDFTITLVRTGDDDLHTIGAMSETLLDLIR